MESAGPEQSPPQLVPRKACGKREPKEELCSRLWPSPTFCFWAAFQVWPVICQLQPATWQDSCLSQRETLSAPHRATDSTLIIQGRTSRWPSHSRTLVWQLSPNLQSHPEAKAGCPARSSEGIQGVGITAGSQEQQAAPRPGSCYFELPSKPPTQSLLILSFLLTDRVPASTVIASSVVCWVPWRPP